MGHFALHFQRMLDTLDRSPSSFAAAHTMMEHDRRRQHLENNIAYWPNAEQYLYFAGTQSALFLIDSSRLHSRPCTYPIETCTDQTESSELATISSDRTDEHTIKSVQLL